MQNCLFCKIAEKQIPSKIIYEDESLVAFEDIQPQAPVHILVIPRKHIGTLNDIGPEDMDIVAGMMSKIKDIAREKGIDGKGYRVVVNCNEHGGQEVRHLHFHLIGGRQMTWPPG